jgi:hypothetical protein|tara:strand:+ start:476 stop:625 length:150 start_codon:yes stop_codon:yes gene_type:complete
MKSFVGNNIGSNENPMTGQHSGLSFLQQRQLAHLNSRKEHLEQAENEFE